VTVRWVRPTSRICESGPNTIRVTWLSHAIRRSRLVGTGLPVSVNTAGVFTLGTPTDPVTPH
jgi:hypothetical protein